MRRRRCNIKTRFEELKPLLYEIFDRCSFYSHQKQHYRSNGKPSYWAMDMRLVLSRGEYLNPIAAQMLEIVRDFGVTQIVGKGFGSFHLVGGITALSKDIVGGLVRPEHKKYGFRKLVEGDIDPEQPLVIVDDLLCSGKTAYKLAQALRNEGFKPVGVVSVFKFGWKDSSEMLERAGLKTAHLGVLRKRVPKRKLIEQGELTQESVDAPGEAVAAGELITS